jgi:hypothetical protein
MEYSLCAVATVARKVKQTDIWTDPSLRVYRRYLNLLIRPTKRAAWEHFEPGLPNRAWHKDWAWRIADHSGFRKRTFESLNNSKTIPLLPEIKGHVIQVAQNYVIFSADRSETYVLDCPPLVARCERSGTTEDWDPRPVSRAIRKLTVDFSKENGGRGTLRTRNHQRAHPCDRWEMSPDDAALWRRELIGVCASIRSASRLR